MTWTVPTGWNTTSLSSVGDDITGQSTQLYWTRWIVDVALDSSVTLDHMLGINRSTGYIELPTGLPWDQGVLVGPGGVSGITALTDAGTALLLVNCATKGRFA